MHTLTVLFPVLISKKRFSFCPFFVVPGERNALSFFFPFFFDMLCFLLYFACVPMHSNFTSHLLSTYYVSKPRLVV